MKAYLKEVADLCDIEKHLKCMDEKVIKVYAEKYGTIRVDLNYMFIEPKVEKQLINEYLFRNHDN